MVFGWSGAQLVLHLFSFSPTSGSVMQSLLRRPADVPLLKKGKRNGGRGLGEK